MKELNELTLEEKNNIRLVVLDVDGVIVPRGTKIRQNGDNLYLRIKKVDKEMIDLIYKASRKYHINISSGRSLFMLQMMFREVIPYVSFTYENGSATYYQGKVYQHVNSETLFWVRKEIDGLSIDKSLIKGFEPKEFIITIHCERRIKRLEDYMSSLGMCYCLWNGEAYDIGFNVQNKGSGIYNIAKILKVKKSQIIAIGDNVNDKRMVQEAGIGVSADASRLVSDYYIKGNILKRKELAGKTLLRKLL